MTPLCGSCLVEVILSPALMALQLWQRRQFIHTILLRSPRHNGLQLLANLGGHLGGLVLGDQGLGPFAGALDDVLGPAILPDVLGGPVNDR